MARFFYLKIFGSTSGTSGVTKEFPTGSLYPFGEKAAGWKNLGNFMANFW
jgi:hypothetical protein